MLYDDLLLCSRWVFISYDGKPQWKTTIGRIFVPTSTMNNGDEGCFSVLVDQKSMENHCSAQLCFFSPGIAEVGRCWDVARKIPLWISGDFQIFSMWTCQSNSTKLRVFKRVKGFVFFAILSCWLKRIPLGGIFKQQFNIIGFKLVGAQIVLRRVKAPLGCWGFLCFWCFFPGRMFFCFGPLKKHIPNFFRCGCLSCHLSDVSTYSHSKIGHLKMYRIYSLFKKTCLKMYMLIMPLFRIQLFGFTFW